jgi:hypothetical protein
LPQVKPLIFGQDVWQVEFMTDDHVLLPRDDKRLRMMRSGFVNLGVPALKAEVIKTVGERWSGPEPYVWDRLLLDAYSLWPDIGSSIVMAYAWLETFIAWALDILQAEHRLLPADLWGWIVNRRNSLKDPSVEEKFDRLLLAFTAKSLKDDSALWIKFTELRTARNSLAHEGVATLHGKVITAANAKSLIDGADAIVAWVELLLPEAHRRKNKGSAIPVRRRFATEEEAVLYDFSKDSEGTV